MGEEPCILIQLLNFLKEIMEIVFQIIVILLRGFSLKKRRLEQ